MHSIDARNKLFIFHLQIIYRSFTIPKQLQILEIPFIYIFSVYFWKFVRLWILIYNLKQNPISFRFFINLFHEKRRGGPKKIVKKLFMSTVPL